MAQRTIETLIGRLITDEEFRSEFLANLQTTLAGLCERGFDLSKSEVSALINTDPVLWVHSAENIDSRLQMASLKNEADVAALATTTQSGVP